MSELTDKQRLHGMSFREKMRWLEVLSSCAIEDNKPAAQCSDILHRHLDGESISGQEVKILMSFIGGKDE